MHAPGGQATAHVAPEERADLVADQAIQHPARLLGIDQVHVHAPGVGKSLGHRVLGDLVKDDAPIAVLGELEGLGQVPGDGLPLAVGVGCQVDRRGILAGLEQVLDHLARLLGDQVLGSESVLNIHAQPAAGQVAHVAHRSLDGVLGAEKAPDGPRLGRRLDDDQVATGA